MGTILKTRRIYHCYGCDRLQKRLNFWRFLALGMIAALFAVLALMK